MNQLTWSDWNTLVAWCREHRPGLLLCAIQARECVMYRTYRGVRRTYRRRAAPVIVAFQAWSLVTP